MSVQRFRDAAQMPRPPRVEGEALAERIRATWTRLIDFEGPLYPPGVHRFRSLDDAQAARSRVAADRMRALRAARSAS